MWFKELESLGAFHSSGLNVLVWPAPYGDQRITPFLESNAVEKVFFVNGGDGKTTRQKRMESDHEKYVSLDRHLDAELVNYDIPGLIQEGKIPQIDIEIARDPAMAVIHSQEMGDLIRKIQLSEGEERKQMVGRQHEMFQEIIEKVAQTSSKIIAKNGFSVYDTDHFGPECTDFKLQERSGSIEELREIHLKEIGSIISNYFNNFEEKSPKNGHEFFVASNR